MRDTVSETMPDSIQGSVRIPAASGEARWGRIGATAAGRLLFVVYTKRGVRIRIIAARPATRSERSIYQRLHSRVRIARDGTAVDDLSEVQQLEDIPGFTTEDEEDAYWCMHSLAPRLFAG